MLIISIKCSDIKTAQHDQAYKPECIHQDGFSLKALQWSWEFTGFKDSFFQLVEDVLWAALNFLLSFQ